MGKGIRAIWQCPKCKKTRRVLVNLSLDIPATLEHQLSKRALASKDVILMGALWDTSTTYCECGWMISYGQTSFDKMKARIAELEAALQPFADFVKTFPPPDPGRITTEGALSAGANFEDPAVGDLIQITFAHFRHAADIMKKEPEVAVAKKKPAVAKVTKEEKKDIEDLIRHVVGAVDYDHAKNLSKETAEEPELVAGRMRELVDLVHRRFTVKRRG